MSNERNRAKLKGVMARPPSNWPASLTSTGFVSVSSSSSAGPIPNRPGATSPTRGSDRFKRQAIDRFDAGVIKTRLDKAYGTTASRGTAKKFKFPLQHGNRSARRQYIHDHVHLPAVHRTAEYLQQVRDHKPTIPAGSSSARTPSKPRPAPLGSKLLSAQLHALQAELLVHYEAEREQPPTRKENQVWSARPPQRSVPHPQPPPSLSDSPARVRSTANSRTFRSQRHAQSKPTTAVPPPE